MTCIEHDQGLTYLRGRHWKGVRDATGAAVAEGAERVDPWVVIAPVAAAVNVLERLHPGPLLFPNTLLTNGRAEGCLQTRVVTPAASPRPPGCAASRTSAAARRSRTPSPPSCA